MEFPQIPVYVISVKSFHDRHQHLAKLAEKYCFQFRYIFEHDVEDLSEKDFSRTTQSMKAKSISNVLKHFEAQRAFLNTDEQIALILEDDVIFLRDFVPRLKRVIDLSRGLDEPWLIFLGGADNKIDGRFMELKELHFNRASAFNCRSLFGRKKRL